MIRVLFVCLGNICRSPMAEMIFKYLVKKENLENKFYIDSAGTSNEEACHNSGIYPNTKAVLKKNNIPFTEHYARQMIKEDYNNFDYIVCMEEYNKHGIMRIVGDDINNKIYRLFDFTDNPKDIDDPWCHRNFDKTYEEILYGCKALLKVLTNQK